MGGRVCKEKREGHDDERRPNKLNSKDPPPQKSRTDSVDRAILQLKLQRDQLQQHKKKLQVMVDNDTEKAKDLLRQQRKKLAIFALKAKTHHEKLIETCDNALLSVLQLIDNTEMARIQADVMKALDAGNQVMKQISREVSVDRLTDILDDMKEFSDMVFDSP